MPFFLVIFLLAQNIALDSSFSSLNKKKTICRLKMCNLQEGGGGGEEEEDTDKNTRMEMRIQHDLAKMAGIKISQF